MTRLALSILLVAPLFVCTGRADDSPITRHLQTLLSVVQQAVVEQAAPVEAAPVEAPSHPLIIRVHESAFGGTAGDQIDQSRRVSRVVVGTPASGTCRTLGAIHVKARSEAESAAFVVSFQGRAHSRTIGVNGPVRIHSQAITDFVVQRTVTFTPIEGFESQQTTVKQSTRLQLDDIQATSRGLRGALVRRVAWKRARESHAAAEREISQTTNAELQLEFDKHLDQRVAELNRQFQIARYVNGILGGPDKLSIQVSSTDDCVQLAVGNAGATGGAVEFPAGCPTVPIEVRIHESAIKERGGAWSETLALVANRATPVAASLQMLKLIAWQPEKGNGATLSFDRGWAVISLDPFATKPNPGEKAVARYPSR